jgi:transcription-repair coupling factor (superfamily II helicase)
VEKGDVLACGDVPAPAQPFIAVLLRQLFPHRPIVVVTESLKTQESFHQDAQTWMDLVPTLPKERSGQTSPRAAIADPALPLFYPAWETLPHESKLPHVDVISERLETLVALSVWTQAKAHTPTAMAPLIVANVNALLQRTFRPEHLRQRSRILARGDRVNPLDLIEWLEDQGYEPEAQVNHKGEIALRGGIVDVFPLTSPWPVRLEFFGDEVESLRYFDPISQISKENIESVVIPRAANWACSSAGFTRLRRQRAFGLFTTRRSKRRTRNPPRALARRQYFHLV